MSIRVEDAQGRTATLDVARLIAEEQQGTVTGAKDGLVYFKTPDGKTKSFGLGAWAEQNQMRVVYMEGFNGPDTALDMPPIGMNYMDQAAFYSDGADLNTLKEMFPHATKRSDGRVVVLDSDGLWKTMWSPLLVAPLPAPSYMERVSMNLTQDPRLMMRQSGIVFALSLAGIEPKNDKHGNLRLDVILKMLKHLSRNCPYENKFQIGKILHQTVGLDAWKFHNGLLAPEETLEWLKFALRTPNSFEYRMKQMELAELVVHGMRAQAQKEFAFAMNSLIKLDETKGLIINLKQLFSEFVQFLVGMDLLRDLSKTTGLNEWIALNEDAAFDKTKLPPMPEFVAAFVQLLKWMMPIVGSDQLAFARGKKGLKSIIALMIMIDECVYSLAGVPDSSAKYKCFMALKKLQTQIETKLSFVYHPDPRDNKDNLKENPFMQAKNMYSQKREELYKLCQLPKESWNNTILTTMRTLPNLEVFYDQQHPVFAGLIKSLLAMDTAYDMQPWVDVNHAERTNDPFSQYQESFGAPPPEAGYLAKNSPRAVQNISETLVEVSGMLLAMPESERNQMLRTPYLLAQLFKTLMVASVNREIGTVEVLSKLGFNHSDDPWASPDPYRIWEDPEAVQADNDRQVQELMGSIAMEAMIQNQGKEQEAQQEQMMQESMRDSGKPEQAGPGPSGPPARAIPMRR